MSFFKKDLEQEGILGAFLDEHYIKVGLKVDRITQINQQHRGVDLLLEWKNKKYKVDEKAQLHYLNNDLPTFALEIDYLKEGKLKLGWLFDADKETEVYAFIFSIHLKNGAKQLTQPTDIKCCDVILVRREKLIHELAEKGLNFEVCKEKAGSLRKEGAIERITISSDFNFQISNRLAEKPVNLVVRKTFLAQIGKQYDFKQ